MKIVFDNKSKTGMQELINNSNEVYLRIKTFRGCGRPAYEIYPSYKGEDDESVEVDGIKFVFSSYDKSLIDGIEIKYDKDLYNNGFYIKQI